MNPTGASQFNQARLEWAIRLRYSPMPELDMGYLASQLNAFRIGEMRVIGKVWEIMMERDGELAVNADKRAADLSGLEWQVVSDGSPDGDKHAQALTYFYKHVRATTALEQDDTGKVDHLIYQVASAHSHRYSIHEMLLRVDNPAGKEVTAEFRHTPVWFFEARRGYLGFLKHIFDMYGQPCVAGEWLTAVGLGWMRPLSMAFAMKHFPLRDWMIFCTRYGSGFLEGITDTQKDSPEWQQAQEALETIANDGVVLHNQGVSFKFLDQAAKNALPFQPIVEMIDRLYAKCYRGVDLATGSRGSGGGAGQSQAGGKNPVGASVQAEESGIFLTRDAKWLTGIFEERIDRPIIRYLFDQEPRAFFSLMPPIDDMTADDLNSAKTLVPMGLQIALKEVYKRFRWTPPAPGETCLQAAQPVMQPGAPGDATPDSNAPAGQEPAKPAAPKPSPKQPAGNAPHSEPETQTTQPAQTQDQTPIAPGADPSRNPGLVQTASRNMPNPQPDAAGFYSRAGASPRGEGERKVMMPALGYAIPNAAEYSAALEKAGKSELIRALSEDMGHVLSRLHSIAQIKDDAVFTAKLQKFLADYPAMVKDLLADPESAKAMYRTLSPAFVNGLADAGRSEAVANMAQDQPRDSLGQWVDENGGGLAEKDNLQRGNRAMDRALRQRADVQKAMYRKEVGRIDFEWGTPGDKAQDYAGGAGISHIVAKHGAEDARAIPEVLAKGKIAPHVEGPEKRLVTHGSYTVSLAKNNSRSAWVLTGYKRGR